MFTWLASRLLRRCSDGNRIWNNFAVRSIDWSVFRNVCVDSLVQSTLFKCIIADNKKSKIFVHESLITRFDLKTVVGAGYAFAQITQSNNNNNFTSTKIVAVEGKNMTHANETEREGSEERMWHCICSAYVAVTIHQLKTEPRVAAANMWCLCVPVHWKRPMCGRAFSHINRMHVLHTIRQWSTCCAQHTLRVHSVRIESDENDGECFIRRFVRVNTIHTETLFTHSFYCNM